MKKALLLLLFPCYLYATNVHDMTIKSGSNYGTDAEVTYMNQLRIALPNLLVGDAFNGTVIEPNYWTTSTVNGSTVTINSGLLCLGTNTTANGDASIQSIAEGDYFPGHEMQFRCIVKQRDATGTALNVKKWGAFDSLTGAFFISSGTSLYGVGYRFNGVDTVISSTSFNKSVTQPNLSNLNTYEIYWTNTKIRYVAAGTMVHEVTATTDQPMSENNLPIRFENTNFGGGTASSTMCVAVASINRNGSDNRVARSQTFTTAGTYVLRYGHARGVGVWIGTLTPGTVSIYDGTSATGTPIVMTVDAKTVAPQYLPLNDVAFKNGLTVVLSANNNVTVYYK